MHDSTNMIHDALHVKNTRIAHEIGPVNSRMTTRELLDVCRLGEIGEERVSEDVPFQAASQTAAARVTIALAELESSTRERSVVI